MYEMTEDRRALVERAKELKRQYEEEGTAYGRCMKEDALSGEIEQPTESVFSLSSLNSDVDYRYTHAMWSADIRYMQENAGENVWEELEDYEFDVYSPPKPTFRSTSEWEEVGPLEEAQATFDDCYRHYMTTWAAPRVVLINGVEKTGHFMKCSVCDEWARLNQDGSFRRHICGVENVVISEVAHVDVNASDERPLRRNPGIKAECPDCLRSFVVRADGEIRQHRCEIIFEFA